MTQDSTPKWHGLSAHVKRKLRKPGWTGGGVAVLVIAGTAAAVATHRNDVPGQADPASVVLEFTAAEVTQPVPMALADRIEFSGALVAPDTVVVKAKVAGTLLALSVAEGGRVAAGQVIGRIDASEANSLLAERRATVASLRAPFLQAQRQHQANIGLAEQQFISETALESSRTAMEAARAQLQAAEAQLTSGRLALRETALVAPIHGLVSKRQALPGEKLSLEQPVVTIVDLSRLELAGVVASHEVGRLAEGLPVEVRIEGVAESVAGRIARIAPAVEPGTRAFGVAITLPNPQEALRAGQYAMARVMLADPAQRLTLPLEAVGRSAGQAHVWVIENGALMRRAVTTGRSDTARGRVEVLGGLAPQATVLAASFDNLREGAPARVAARPAGASASSPSPH
jgi:membrane fusion protein, multidrug efflux system